MELKYEFDGFENAVFVETFKAPPFNISEIFRYAGDAGKSPETEQVINECITEVKDLLSYNVCYTCFPVTETEGGLDLGFCKTPSQSLKKTLEGCNSGVLFAATVGANIDRLINKYGKISPLKAVILQAIGAERIESLCDAFCSLVGEEAEKDKKFTRQRVSAGYGDIPLSMQTDIFACLECTKRIGLTLNDSLFMSPSKSVTGIIGISDFYMRNGKLHDCKNCDKTDCPFRRVL